MLAIGNTPLTLAFGTGLVDGAPGATAVRAGDRRLHVAEERMLHAHDMTRPVAGRAFDLRTVLGGTAATAFLAGGEAIVDDVLLRAAGDFLEREAKPDSHVATVAAHLLGSSAAHAAEEGTEDVAHATEDVTHVDGLIATETLCGLRRTIAVVQGFLLGIGEHVIRLVELLEALFGIGGLVDVRMQFTRLAPERLLYLRYSSLARNTENFVILIRHAK